MSTQIMAIINTDPDSFSGDGLDIKDEAVLHEKLQTALGQGADIVDIGGQSTRPGAAMISVQEEIARVVPAISLARQLTNQPISIDTFKPEVARAAFTAGATILNDVTGFADSNMIQLARQTQCDIVVMHMRGTPQTMTTLTHYPNGVVHEIKAFFEERTQRLIAAGIAPEKIIIDPGIGFAKSSAQSFEITNQLEVFVRSGFRVLYGASNKGFIGKALAYDGQIAPIEERYVGTLLLQAYAMDKGASIIRTHDVKAAVQTRAILEALHGPKDKLPSKHP